MSNIAPLSTISNALDTVGKLIRLLEREGVTSEYLFLPINDTTARRNLADYLEAGCPHLYADVSRPLAKPKVLGGLLEQVGEPINLPFVKRFVSSETFSTSNEEVPIRQNTFLGFVEQDVQPVVVKRRSLLRKSSNTSILDALGGADVALAHIHKFLKTADHNERYLFYHQGSPRLFYWFTEGVSFSIGGASSGKDGWDCEYEDEWPAGILVVSR